MILKYTKEHNLNKLNNELIQLDFLRPIQGETELEGIVPVAFIKSNGDELELRIETNLDDSQIEEIEQIINMHNSTPLPKQPTQYDFLLDLDYRLSMIELGV